MNNTSSQKKIELDSLENEYGEEVMYAGWNPLVTLPYQQQQLASGKQPTTATTDPMMAEAELFLKKIYASQR